MDHALPLSGVTGKSLYSPGQSLSRPMADPNPQSYRSRDDAAVFSSAAREALEQAYQRLQTAPANAVDTPPGPVPTPADSAAVILGFIESRLQNLAAEGADTEQLSALLQQGLEGFRKGLEQARSILSGLERLTEAVSAGIAETQSRVLQGLGDISGRFGLVSPVDVEPASAPPQEPVETSQATPAAPIATRAAYFQAAFERRESVQLELQTRDGDLITLSLDQVASSRFSLAGATASGPRGESAILAYQQTQSLQSRFSFSVQGELDEGELTALRLLINDVASISDEFFAGNFEQAFNQAQSLNLDSKTFSSLSLDLSLLTRSSVMAGTSNATVEPGAAEAAPSPAPVIHDQALSQLQRLLDMLQLANRFARPGDLLADLLAARLADSRQGPADQPPAIS